MATTMVESSNIADDQANNNEVDNDTRIKIEQDCNEQSFESNDNTDNNGTSNESNEKTNLIVNYLPQQMSDQDFENLFKKFGNMKSCKIVRNRVSGYSYGFGFVDFETHSQALQAIEELNGHELENKKIKVAFARPAGQDIKQANLYIKNVPDGWDQDELKNIFEPYGNIIQIRVLGNNRGVAFVLYDLRKQAEDALEALNGTTPEGCDKPLEIKFAADKKAEKGGNKNKNSNNNNNVNDNNNKNSGNNNSRRHRERGSRGGRDRDRGQRNQNRQGRNQNQRSFFDRQNNNYDDRKGNRGGQGNFNNATPYSGGAQYFNNYNSNGVGPMRQVPSTRMNRYAPFVPIQQPMDSNTLAAQTTGQMAPQMTANPAYGFASQQQMIPFAMMQTQQINPMQQMGAQPGQALAQGAMGMYAAPMTMGFTPVQQNQMNSMYNMTGALNPAATMQAPMSQPIAPMNRTVNQTSNGTSGNSGGSSDDGITLFVYNIGPDSDENELRGMFSPYGHVVKCNVVRKTPGGETKGFGFVTLSNRDQANAAISGLNGSMRNGRALQVSLKK